MEYTLTNNGLDFLANEEGPKGPALKAYWDENGYAIGYGNHTYEDGSAVKKYDTITADRAVKMLQSYVNTQILPYFNTHVTAFLSHNQVDSIISFMYNGGPGVLTSTNLHNVINKNPDDKEGVINCYYKIRKGVSTKVSLIPRRNRELNLYFTSNYQVVNKAYAGTNYFTNLPQLASTANASKDNAFSVRYANDRQIVDLTSFIKYWRLQTTPDDLLNFSDNQATLYNNYRKKNKDKYGTGVASLVEYGTALKIPNIAVPVRSVYNIQQTLSKNESFECFLETQMKNLLFNPKYKKVNTLDTFNDFGQVFKRHEQVTVLWWSRALCPEETKLIDISEFIDGVSVSNGMNGGTFQLKLPKITYDIRPDNCAITSDNPNDARQKYQVYLKNKVDTTVEDKFFVEEHVTHTQQNFSNQKTNVYNSPDDNDYLKENNNMYFKRTNNLFNDVMQKNDILFICFERIELESESNRKTISKQDVGADGFRWIEANLLPNNIWDTMVLVDRVNTNSSDGALEYATEVQGRDFSKVLIDDGVQFFMITYGLKNFSEIAIGADSFARERFVISNIDDKTKSDFQRNISTISNTAIQDTGFNFFKPHTINEFLTYIFSKLTHQVVTETNNLFKGYKNKSFIISSSAAKSENDLNIEYKKVPADGIWQITKLVVDPSIANRYILDFSFINDSGSLINFIRKVCQMPFVQFFSDTYGDQFYYIVRKPPFNESAYKNNFCLNIYEDEVFEDELDYSDQSFCYYQLNPLGSIIKDPVIFMQYLPAVIFPEYLKIFGNKMLKVDSNYLDFDFSDNTQSQADIDKIIKQHREDMDFLIETTAYLPFTRCGRIVIKKDRRIKKGINIRYMPTGEIFHVDGVAHTLNFVEGAPEASTVLEVSRGMVEQHYDKYFRLINLYRRGGETKNTWKVNNDIFNFFLQRRQYTNV